MFIYAVGTKEITSKNIETANVSAHCSWLYFFSSVYFPFVCTQKQQRHEIKNIIEISLKNNPILTKSCIVNLKTHISRTYAFITILISFMALGTNRLNNLWCVWSVFCFVLEIYLFCFHFCSMKPLSKDSNDNCWLNFLLKRLLLIHWNVATLNISFEIKKIRRFNLQINQMLL